MIASGKAKYMKTGMKIKPYKGVAIKGGFTKYAVSANKKKADGTWEKVGWLSVMVKDGKVIPDGNPDKTEIMIDEITGVDLELYNGKTYTTVWAKAHPEGDEPGTASGFSQLDESIPF